MTARSVTGTAHAVRGAGPAVVLPQCNVDWADFGLRALVERFTVVAVAPRGFMGSDRLAPADYSAEQLTGDIERVLDDLGIDSYAALGYSLNGAVASYLAMDNPRVRGVVCGGFPTTTYAALAASRRAQLAERQRDPQAWAETTATLDPAALVTFWEAVDRLPPAALVDRVGCPVWSWWGGADPLFEEFGGVAAHRAAIEARGLPHRELPGLDHHQALTAVEEVLPEVADWLEPHLRADPQPARRPAPGGDPQPADDGRSPTDADPAGPGSSSSRT